MSHLDKASAESMASRWGPCSATFAVAALRAHSAPPGPQRLWVRSEKNMEGTGILIVVERDE
jgi:hypothetical protein